MVGMNTWRGRFVAVGWCVAVVGLAWLFVACGGDNAMEPDTPAPAVDGALLGELAGDELAWANRLSARAWDFDYEQRTVDITNLVEGCAPQRGLDCICAIGGNDSARCGLNYSQNAIYEDAIAPPQFVSVDEALGGHLVLNDPVVAVNLNGEQRAYPLSILTLHEIVNDTLGDAPISVTYCPLCNSALVFSRFAPGGGVLNFGVSGLLLNSDLVMFDRETRTLWQQFTGRGIVGEHAGVQLTLLPAALVTLEQFRDSYSDGEVLLGPLPDRLYDARLYAGYENSSDQPFLFRGQLDGRLVPTSRILGLNVGEAAVAYAFNGLAANPIQHDQINGTDIVIFYDPDTFSPFNAVEDDNFLDPNDDPSARLVSGSAVAYSPQVNGTTLQFEKRGDDIVDTNTNSVWSQAGVAVSGELAGSRLEIISSGNHFWFAWAAFNPETEIRGI